MGVHLGSPPAEGCTRKLTLYLGAHICDGRLTVSAPNKKEASQIVSSHNSSTVDITWLAASEMTVTWGKEDEEEGGNVTWQAAVLALSDGAGALTLQAITLS